MLTATQGRWRISFEEAHTTARSPTCPPPRNATSESPRTEPDRFPGVDRLGSKTRAATPRRFSSSTSSIGGRGCERAGQASTRPACRLRAGGRVNESSYARRLSDPEPTSLRIRSTPAPRSTSSCSATSSLARCPDRTSRRPCVKTVSQKARVHRGSDTDPASWPIVKATTSLLQHVVGPGANHRRRRSQPPVELEVVPLRQLRRPR